MANPTILGGAVNRTRKRVIVTCQVDSPPLVNHIPNPTIGWTVLVNGSGVSLDGGAVAQPAGNQVELNLLYPVLDSDLVKIAYNAGFGDTFDSAGNIIFTVPNGNAITCTFDSAGCFILPMLNLRALLGGSATWQNWVSAVGDAPKARSLVHVIAPTPPVGGHYETAELTALRNPVYAKVNWGGGAGTWNSSRMANGKFTAEGQLELTVEAAVAAQNSAGEIDSELDFLSNLEALVSDMARMDEGLGFLVPNSIAIADGPRRAGKRSQSSEGDYYTARLTVGFNSPL